MRRAAAVLLLLLSSCSPVRMHFVSPDLSSRIREPMRLKVESDPPGLSVELEELAASKLALVAQLVPSAEGGTISVSFRTKRRITMEGDEKDPFSTRPGGQPGKRHVFQAAEIELGITGADGREVYRTVYRYEGRNDYNAGYTQTPEQAMEECLIRVVGILEKDIEKLGGRR